MQLDPECSLAAIPRNGISPRERHQSEHRIGRRGFFLGRNARVSGGLLGTCMALGGVIMGEHDGNEGLETTVGGLR